ncbi:hypothetical protein FOA52_015069 [Chlamydomonas sp. UWO 241]|nr:hypothetical protein FOA52_015069 [Chlamydomonas sp. UWO 241]
MTWCPGEKGRADNLVHALERWRGIKALSLNFGSLDCLAVLSTAQLTGLTKLSIRQNRLGSWELPAFSPSLAATLTFLDVSHSSLTCIEAVRSCTQLRVVRIASTIVDDLSPLGACSQLEELWMAGCNNVRGFACLAGCPRLRKFDLHTSTALPGVYSQLEALTVPCPRLVDPHASVHPCSDIALEGRVHDLEPGMPAGVQEAAATALRSLMDDENARPGIADVITSVGAIPSLVAFSSAERQAEIAAAGGVPLLVQLLEPDVPHFVQHAAAGTLVNLSCKSAALKAAIVATDAIQLLAPLLQSHHPAVARSTSTLSNLATTPRAAAAIMAAGALPSLVSLLGDASMASGGVQQTVAVCCLLKNLAQSGGSSVAGCFATAGGIHAMVPLLGPGYPVMVQEEAAVALGALCSSGSTEVQAALFASGAGPLMNQREVAGALVARAATVTDSIADAGHSSDALAVVLAVVQAQTQQIASLVDLVHLLVSRVPGAPMQMPHAVPHAAHSAPRAAPAAKAAQPARPAAAAAPVASAAGAPAAERPARPAAAAAPVASAAGAPAAERPAAAGAARAASARGPSRRGGLPARVGETSLCRSHVLSIPVAAATRLIAGRGSEGQMARDGIVRGALRDASYLGSTRHVRRLFSDCYGSEETAVAAAAVRVAAAAVDGVSLPVCLAMNLVRFVHDVSGRDRPAGGGVVSASFLNAKPAVGGIGVEPRRGGVLRVLFTVASDAVADTVVRSRRNLRDVDPSAAVFDVLSDREEAQHRALWPAFLAAKAAGKRAQFHRARLVVDGERDVNADGAFNPGAGVGFNGESFGVTAAGGAWSMLVAPPGVGGISVFPGTANVVPGLRLVHTAEAVTCAVAAGTSSAADADLLSSLPLPLSAPRGSLVLTPLSTLLHAACRAVAAPSCGSPPCSAAQREAALSDVAAAVCTTALGLSLPAGSSLLNTTTLLMDVDAVSVAQPWREALLHAEIAVSSAALHVAELLSGGVSPPPGGLGGIAYDAIAAQAVVAAGMRQSVTVAGAAGGRKLMSQQTPGDSSSLRTLQQRTVTATPALRLDDASIVATVLRAAGVAAQLGYTSAVLKHTQLLSAASQAVANMQRVVAQACGGNALAAASAVSQGLLSRNVEQLASFADRLSPAAIARDLSGSRVLQAFVAATTYESLAQAAADAESPPTPPSPPPPLSPTPKLAPPTYGATDRAPPLLFAGSPSNGLSTTQPPTPGDEPSGFSKWAKTHVGAVAGISAAIFAGILLSAAAVVILVTRARKARAVCYAQASAPMLPPPIQPTRIGGSKQEGRFSTSHAATPPLTDVSPPAAAVATVNDDDPRLQLAEPTLVRAQQVEAWMMTNTMYNESGSPVETPFHRREG